MGSINPGLPKTGLTSPSIPSAPVQNAPTGQQPTAAGPPKYLGESPSSHYVQTAQGLVPIESYTPEQRAQYGLPAPSQPPVQPPAQLPVQQPPAQQPPAQPPQMGGGASRTKSAFMQAVQAAQAHQEPAPSRPSPGGGSGGGSGSGIGTPFNGKGKEVLDSLKALLENTSQPRRRRR